MDKLKKIPPECVSAATEISKNYNGPVHIGRTKIGKELVIGKVLGDWKKGYCK